MLGEATGLATTLGWDVVYEEIVRQRDVSPRMYLGKGKVEDLRGIASHVGADVVFVNTPMLTVSTQSRKVMISNVEWVLMAWNLCIMG